jgi:hypothetical protein
VRRKGGIDADAIYGVYFHGPAYRVLERAWTDEGEATGLFAATLPDDRVPMEPPLLSAPRLLELAFQTAGVWELARGDRFALPERIGRVTFAGAAPSGRVTARVTPGEDGFEAEVVDGSGSVLVRLERYRTVEVPGAAATLDLSAFHEGATTK